MTINEPDPVVPTQVGTPTDAKNRSIRTLIQGLVADVMFAVVLFLFPIFGNDSFDWNTADWKWLGLALAKTIVVTVLSYLMRTLKISPRTTTV